MFVSVSLTNSVVAVVIVASLLLLLPIKQHSLNAEAELHYIILTPDQFKGRINP